MEKARRPNTNKPEIHFAQKFVQTAVQFQSSRPAHQPHNVRFKEEHSAAEYKIGEAGGYRLRVAENVQST
jgi:hypothetical protein